MKLKFVKDCELEVVENYDETDDVTDSALEIFKAGEVIDVDSENESEQYWDIQFGDGSVAFCVQKALTEVLED